ncbi:hypothetical protein [Dyella amyloliquefaciens]|uniref:hypothetical protein n=1 Tax=Dyella amyloliquefaciens TaxID=1770545 RepID=UPI00102E75BE|nr:hypothetical protein [Dyella amyloliquefaciens]
MQKSGYLIIGCVAISIVAFWSSVSNFRARPTDLVEVRGAITGKRCVEGRHGNIAVVELEVAGSTEVYPYPDILPRARELCERMNVGTDVELRYSRPGRPEIWSVAIEGKSFIDAQEAESARRSNGWWGLAVGMFLLLGGLVTWSRYGFDRRF